jgi:hypothetical protein
MPAAQWPQPRRIAPQRVTPSLFTPPPPTHTRNPTRQHPPNASPPPQIGDRVRVLSGAHKGETGMVVAVERGVCAVVGDATKAQFRVNARDLTEDVDTGEGIAVGGAAGAGVGEGGRGEGPRFRGGREGARAGGASVRRAGGRAWGGAGERARCVTGRAAAAGPAGGVSPSPSRDGAASQPCSQPDP